MADVNKPRGRGRPRGSGRGVASRVQAPREVQNVAAVSAAPELIARRNKRHVEELERSNYADAKGTDAGTGLAGNRSRTTLADECNKGRKKSTVHVRSILLYRKNLNTIIEQEGLASLPSHVTSYLTAAAPESVIEVRKLCSGARPHTRRHDVNGESFDLATITRHDGFGFDSIDLDICDRAYPTSDLVAARVEAYLAADTGDRPYACQTCGDRFARSDLLSRHVNKCHTPGGLSNTSRKQGARNQSAAEDKKRRPCDECSQHSTKCDFGRPSCNNCSSRGSKCSYPKTKRARRNTNPSPRNAPGTLPERNVPLSHESMPINSFGHYQEDIPPFSFHYQPPESSIAMPPMYDNGMSVPNPASSTFMGSPEAPSLSFSAATSESADSSSPWNGMDLMGLNNMPSNFDGSVFPDPNAPSYTSTHKFQTSMGSPFNYNIELQEPSQLPLTSLHQRSASASYGRHPAQHHQRHRSSPSLDGSHSLLNHTLLRAQGQQYPAITPTRLYMHRGSLSASDSGTEYESPVRPGTASEYTDFPSPMSLVNSESGSTSGIGRSIDDMALHDPGAGSLLSMGPMMVPGIGMGTGLTPANESPSRPMMTQRQSTLGDLKAFWNECLDNQNSSNGESRAHSLSKMTSMPCLKTPMGDATPRAAAADPLARINQQRPPSGAGQTPRVGQSDSKGLEQYRTALNALPAPSLRMAPKMKAAVAKQEESESSNIKIEPTFSAPFAPGSAQDDAWRSLMSSTGSYVMEPTGNRPNYKRLPSQTLGPENSKRVKDGDDSSVFTDDDEDTKDDDYQQSQEWHRRMSLPVMGRSGAGASRLHQPQPVPIPGSRQDMLN
ncbi:unnamed protein product [Rhizoctonia solani]|uniref:C2H2-type domain-containing protein n=1 Tax=Rhizoctonia solani TaxID=456999 RepID=A0A8H3ACT2_9AGAM|nr:unnamed protein product [Rhizoctonia solani]